MALKVGELYAVLTAEDRGFARAMERAKSSMEQARKMSMGLLGAVGAAAGTFGVAALRGIQLAGQMEQTKIAFTTLLGSAKAADDFVRQLWDFAARTPFEFEGIANAARQLLAFGFQAKEILPLATAVGDAISALGGGAVEIDRVIRALGQMRAKGKVSAEEMMQLAELGIPAWEMLAQAIGTSIPEAMDRASKGAIPAAVGIQAIVEGMAKRFAGSMEMQSRTLLGQWSTFRDNLDGILRAIGEDIIRAFDLTGVLARVNDALGRLGDILQEGGLRALAQAVPPWLAGAIVAVAGAITGALLPALISLAQTAYQLARTAVIALGPWAAAGAAVALAAYLIWRNWDRVRPIWEQLRAAAEPALRAIRQLVADLAAYLAAVWPDIQRNIQTFIAWVAPIFRTVFGGLLALVRSTVQGVATALRGIVTVVGGIVQAIAAVLAGDWAGAWAAAQRIVQGAAQIILGIVQGSLFGPLLGLLADLGGRVVQWAQQAWGAFVQRVQEVVAQAGQLFADLRGVAIALWDVLTGGPEQVAMAMEFLGQVFGGVFARMGEIILAGRQRWQDFLDFLRRLPGMAAEFLATLPERVAYIIGLTVSTAIRIISDLPEATRRAWERVRDATVQLATQAKDRAIALVQAMLTGVTTWLSQLPGRAETFLRGVAARVQAWFGQARTTATTQATALVTDVTTWLASLPGRAQEALAALPGRIRAVLDKAKATALSAVQALVDGVRGLVSQIPGIFSSIFDRVWNIISSWPGRLAAKARSIAASFWEGFKDGLGIHSPSYVERAFMAIEDQAWSTLTSLRRMVPAIKPLLSEVAQPVLPTIRPAAAAAPATTMPAPVQVGTVHVTVQARDLRDVEDVLSLFRNLRQAARAGV